MTSYEETGDGPSFDGRMDYISVRVASKADAEAELTMSKRTTRNERKVFISRISSSVSRSSNVNTTTCIYR